jgi:uncharacterized protein with HEPN domain
MTKNFDPRITLFDILTFSERCLQYTKDLSLEQFKDDALTFSAVQYNLIILAEAIKILPAKEEKYKLGTQQDLISKLGSDLIDKYYDVDSNKIWSAVKNELPSFIEKINAMLENLK